MGLLSKLLFHDPEEEDRKNVEGNEYYQNKLGDADLHRSDPELREGHTIQDGLDAEEETNWWRWGVRRN